MEKSNNQEKKLNLQIEKNDTAAWANIDGLKIDSKTNIPDELQVWNAKEYVDSNQK